VSHDREFINNVVTSTLALEGEGRVNEYVGGYDDWLRQRKPKPEAPVVQSKPEQKKEAPRPQPEKKRKLTFKEQKELDTLPKRIEDLEAEQEKTTQTMADPVFYRENGAKVTEYTARLEVLKKELADAYARWEDLDAVKG